MNLNSCQTFGFNTALMNLRTNTIIKLATLAWSFCCTSEIYSQQDFNNFSTLKAVGQMPADFSVSTKEKIENDKGTREQLSKKSEKIFLQGIHYSIDELLHSGLVIYGDEISTYVAKVADNLLKNDPELRAKLRFYTLKSNATNAFSTDQGIVFVTTGLVSQLTSESQLAYVLAHEISHYTQHHVVETFDFKRENKKYHDRIYKLSTYSREKEFEADKLGIKLYQEAGYSKNELLGCFDVLLYSYLPFEDLEVPKTYFNTNLAFIPEKYFAKKSYPIKAEEDQDDAQSSHPNIKKRKEAAEKEITKFANWGDQRFIFGEAEFIYIRNISRFESVRTDILDSRYVDALYSILILEKTYPASVYLAKMKAHAWLGFAQIAYEQETHQAIMRTVDLEGEIAAMHYLFGKINKSSIGVLALRYITDLKLQYPENEEIKTIWKTIVKTVSHEEKFALDKFSEKTFYTASAEFQKIKKDTVVKIDTAAKISSETKYQKIRKKKDVNASENFDSTNYELYLISDLVNSEEFKDLYKDYKADFEKKESEKDSILALSRRDRARYWKLKNAARYNKGVTDLMVIQPTAEIIKPGNKLNSEKSLKAEEGMIRSMKEVGEMLEMNVRIMNMTSEFVTSTDDFNNRSRVFSYIEQRSNNEHDDILPVDLEDLALIKTKYNTSNIAFMNYTHDFRVQKAWFLSIMAGFFPIFYTYPMAVLHGFRGEFSFVILDMTTGEIILSRTEKMMDANTKSAVKARIYIFLSDLKKAPKTSH